MQTSLQFYATHLYLSDCLSNPQLQKQLQHFRQNFPDKQITIEFQSTETLTIDTNLSSDLFHGIDVHFESKIIYIEPNKGSAANEVRIDVSGNNAQEHDQLKPRKPYASGCNGVNGLHGRVGESG